MCASAAFLKVVTDSLSSSSSGGFPKTWSSSERPPVSPAPNSSPPKLSSPNSSPPNPSSPKPSSPNPSSISSPPGGRMELPVGAGLSLSVTWSCRAVASDVSAALIASFTGSSVTSAGGFFHGRFDPDLVLRAELGDCRIRKLTQGTPRLANPERSGIQREMADL